MVNNNVQPMPAPYGYGNYDESPTVLEPVEGLENALSDLILLCDTNLATLEECDVEEALCLMDALNSAVSALTREYCALYYGEYLHMPHGVRLSALAHSLTNCAVSASPPIGVCLDSLEKAYAEIYATEMAQQDRGGIPSQSYNDLIRYLRLRRDRHTAQVFLTIRDNHETVKTVANDPAWDAYFPQQS